MKREYEDMLKINEYYKNKLFEKEYDSDLDSSIEISIDETQQIKKFNLNLSDVYEGNY